MLKIVTIAVATVTLAGLAAAAATGSALGRFRPDMVNGMPIAAGPALASSARLRLADSAAEAEGARQVSAIFPDEVGDSVTALARAAFAREPMSTEAIMTLALAADAAGRTDTARALFERGQAISRRNGLTSLWLAQDAALHGRVPGTLRYFDQLLRTSRDSRPLLLEQFALATADPSFRGEMAKLLRKDPPWAREFWEIAPSVTRAARPVGELRLALAGTRGSFNRYSDEQVAVNLINSGEADLALRLYRAIAASPEDSAGVIVRNAEFAQARQFPPIDWQTFSSGDRGSEIAPEDSLLFLFAINGPEAAVARQFVVLDPGSYRLSARMRSTGRAADDTVRIKLYCTGQNSPGTSIVVPLGEGLTQRNFTIPAGSCRERWLDILAEPADRNPGFDAELDFVKIDRA